MAIPDYYRILGVAPYSEDVVIQAAYRALMLRYHPDTNKTADAGKRATEINEAYAVLGSPARKARYDADRKAARDKAKARAGPSAGFAPPPSPPPSGSSSAAQQVVPTGDRQGAWIATWIIGAVLALSAFAASQSGMQTADNNMAVDNLTVDNLVIDNSFAAVETEPDLPTLASLSQTPVRYDDIESAATRFAKVLASRGMSGARALSEECHAGVVKEPTWSKADWCAAFDYAAAYFDSKFSAANGLTQMPYFDFQSKNQADRYTEAGAGNLFVSSRLASIKAAAESAAEDAIMREIRRSEATRTTSAESAGPKEADDPSKAQSNQVTLSNPEPDGDLDDYDGP